jgi:hypothetical protein
MRARHIWWRSARSWSRCRYARSSEDRERERDRDGDRDGRWDWDRDWKREVDLGLGLGLGLDRSGTERGDTVAAERRRADFRASGIDGRMRENPMARASLDRE